LDRVNVSLDTLDPEKYAQITRGGDIHKVLEGLTEAKKQGLTPVKINMVVGEWTNEKDKADLQEFSNKHGFELRFIQKMDLDKGEFSVVEGGMGGDCLNCNRLRVTSNGFLKPCLFSDLAYDIRMLGIQEAFRQALENKPKAGTNSSKCTFYRIGG
jgi:cyclic pyranopterin phosphate synthase